MAMESTAIDQSEVFKQLDEYPWDKDREFQGGLAAILGPNPNPSQVTDLTLRAQCFYLSRKRSIPIDFDAYKEHLLSKPATDDSVTSPFEASATQAPTIPSSEQATSQPTTASSSATPAEQELPIPSTAQEIHSSPLPANTPSHYLAPHIPHDLPLDVLNDNDDNSPRQAPYPKSFAEIVELITSGKPIPGIKDIPNDVRPDLASKPMLPKRRKPWEKDVPQEQIDGKIGGLFGDERDIYIPQEFPEDA